MACIKTLQIGVQAHRVQASPSIAWQKSMPGNECDSLFGQGHLDIIVHTSDSQGVSGYRDWWGFIVNLLVWAT